MLLYFIAIHQLLKLLVTMIVEILDKAEGRTTLQQKGVTMLS